MQYVLSMLQSGASCVHSVSALARLRVSLREQISIVRGVVAQIVTARASELATERAERACAARNLLDVMLMAKDTAEDYLSAEEVVDQVLTFLIAGHETTSNALSWMWYLLSQHPEVEARMRAESVRIMMPVSVLAATRVLAPT